MEDAYIILNMRGISDSAVIYLLRHTWTYSAGRRHWLLGHGALTVIANVFHVLQPLALAEAFNTAQLAPDDPQLLRHIVMYLLLYFAAGVAFRAFFHVSGLIEGRNSFFVSLNYRQTLMEKVLALPASWHRDHHSASTIHMVERASGRLGSFSGNIYILIENVMRVVGAIVVLAFYDWPASVAALLICVLASALIRYFDKRLKREYEIEHRQGEGLAALIHDSIANILTVIALHLQPSVAKRLREASLRTYPDQRRRGIITANKWSSAKLMIAFFTTATVILYAVTSYRARGVILAGTLFTLYKYMTDMVTVFNDSANRFSKLIDEETAVRGAEEIERAYDALGPSVAASLPEGWRRVDIKDLTFSYASEDAGAEAFVMEGLRLSFARGERIAFVGESGAGKSTLLMLLRGLYPAGAQVRADGQLLPSGLAHLKPHITFIPQEPEIFDTTVEQNITMSLEYAPKAVAKAMALARFTTVLPVLTRGLETRVMEKGVRLSGGQKQRLALARGFLAAADSEILLMDEPTSSIDAVNERRIYEGIFAAMPGKTVLSTVHRLHLLPLFDRVYYFVGGKIAVSGTLEELLAYEEFRSLWEMYHRTQPKEA